MIESNFASWDKGIFSVINKPGGPTFDEVVNPKHFYRRDNKDTNYDQQFEDYGPEDITYKFNKYGFRSDEFVDDGRDNILSVGDSFTMCMGVPVEHSWSYMLSKKFDNCKNYNLGLAAASSDYVVRAVSKTIEELKPKAVFVFWPGLSSREVPIRNMYLPFKTASSKGENNKVEQIFEPMLKLLHDNTYIIYQYRKNVELLRAICKAHNVPCQELEMCTYTKPLESVNIAMEEAEYDFTKIDNVQFPPGQELGFSRTTRDGVHLSYEWNKHISELFYTQYIKNTNT